MNAKSSGMVAQFEAFCRNAPDEFADFQLVNEPEKKLKALLYDDRKVADFRVIGRHGAGSLMAFWKADKETDLTHGPMVWLSSEGFPNSVFASTFEDFLSLLPYGTDFIYDILSNYYNHQQSPQLQPAPKEKFTPAKIKSYFNQAKKRYKGHAALIDWLTNQANIPVAENPLVVIEKAILAHPDLASWLKK
jgi:hypothetical protein